ncbi:MAG: tetratricopeptide repeat protein [Acidobacteria bacterium]|nr:tetratricopeptide repeat protein [Acidobacteriota bacterium]
MNRQECLRARSLRALLLVLLAVSVAFAASCSNPEKTKAEHVSRGEAFLKEKKWQEATLEFRNAIQIDEKLAPAHWGLAQAYEQLGRIQEALEELQLTVKLDPNNFMARLKLANAYLLAYANGKEKNAEFLAQAEQFANEILARDAKNPDGHILLANVLSIKGDQKQAEEKIKYAISLDPQRVESYMGLAKFYSQTNRAADAEAAYRQAITVNDRSSLAHVEYGRFLVQAGRTEAAEAEFRKAAEVEPENRDVRWILASFYLVNKRMDEAEAAYKAWAQLDWDKPEGRARLADYYATVGRYDEAANLYKDILQSSPDYARGRYRLGEISLQRGDTQGANAQVDELLKKNARDMEALFLRARLRLAGGKAKEAVADLKTVLDQDARNRLGLYFMSEALYRDGQLEQARARAGELERFHPDFLPAKLLQIQINFDAGDPETARRLAGELLERLSKTAPNGEQTPQLLADVRTSTHLLRGKANLNLRQLAAARADMEAARASSPNSPLPYVNLADVAFTEGKRPEAVQHIERALQLDRFNSQALTAMTNLAAQDGRLAEARSRIEQLISEQPNSPALQYLRGQSYRIGSEAQPPDAQRAEEAFRRAVEIDADYMAAYTALAEIYFATNQPDRAIAEYRKITERRPDSFEAYRNIGLIEAGRNNHDAAAEHYRRVLSIRPDEPVAANNLAMLYADHGKGNADEAMQLAQDIVRRYPNNPGFADTLGWVYFKKGLNPAAVDQLQKAVSGASKAGGDNSLYRYHLGKALAAKGDRAAARRELQKCLELAALEQQRTVKATSQTPLDDVRRTLESL